MWIYLVIEFCLNGWDYVDSCQYFIEWIIILFFVRDRCCLKCLACFSSIHSYMLFKCQTAVCRAVSYTFHNWVMGSIYPGYPRVAAFVSEVLCYQVEMVAIEMKSCTNRNVSHKCWINSVLWNFAILCENRIKHPSSFKEIIHCCDFAEDQLHSYLALGAWFVLKIECMADLVVTVM